ncbi:MAG: DPP IV N-terminal domain-containing protein [Limisphaerales bacterium]
MLIGTLALVGVPTDLPEIPPKPPAGYKTSIRAQWTGDTFWYRNDLPSNRREFVFVDAANGVRRPAFDHQAVARQIGREVDPERLPVQNLRYSDDAITLIGEGKSWKLDRKTGKLSEQDAVRRPSRSQRRSYTPLERVPPKTRRRSPDGKWEAFVREHNLWVRSRKSGKEIKLTIDAKPKDSFHFDATQERAISMRYDRKDEPAEIPDVYWSPDSKRLIAMQTQIVPQRIVSYVEAAPRGALHPHLKTYPYLKPGDPIPARQPRLFDPEAGREIAVATDKFAMPWRFTRLRWERDSSRFSFLHNQRGHQLLRVIGIDAKSGDVSTLVKETSNTFIDYAYKSYLRFVKNGEQLIWMSERDGWNHLYLCDTKKGSVINQITKGKWLVKSVENTDETKRQIWFHAVGVIPGQDPYYTHLCRVNFDGSDFKVLTKGDGTHSVRFSPDRKYFIDTWSRVDKPPVHQLRRSSDGELICELETADLRAWRHAGYRYPERFVAKGRDDKTDIHGIIHYPRDFDPKKKYAVIESIYAGPHGAFVPKAFRTDYTSRRELTEKGFIVVQIDGMGTNWRSRKFHDVCWRNLGDAGFPDRIRWIKAAAKTRPFMDLSRVGIYGGSAGGQNAMRALIAHHDFYHIAVADCGCHDNRMDKIWWNEAWMGWPLGKHYEESSNYAQAHRLQGHLLLMLGGEDRNVDPASTIQVVDALVKAGKNFDFVLQPSSGHGSAGSSYGKKRQLDFFIRHLGTTD